MLAFVSQLHPALHLCAPHLRALQFVRSKAEAKSADPISRESTRLRCVMAFVPQTTPDPKQMKAWIPNNAYGNHAFGLPSMAKVADRPPDLGG